MADTVTVDGVDLWFEIHGEGTPLVYTPGAFYSMESSRAVAQALAPMGYRVLLWDRPNTGRSGLLFEPGHMLHLWADKLKGLLGHVGIPSAYFVGVVNGLLFSLHFAARHRERVRGLALVAALTDDTQWWYDVVEATFLEPARIIEGQGMAAALEEGGGRWGVFDWVEQFSLAPHKREELLALDPAVAATALRSWAKGYTGTGLVWAGGLTDEQLSRLDVPAIVFSGAGGSMDAYPVHSPEDARRLHQALPNSQLVISSSHLGTQWPTVLEQLANPEASFDPLVVAVSSSVDRFVRDLESSDG
jgi:2-hydroxy-6-oxonona-2,4-dienedioate hydrolase